MSKNTPPPDSSDGRANEGRDLVSGEDNGAGHPPGSGRLLPRAWSEDDRLTDLDREIGRLLLSYGPNGHYPSMADLAKELAKAGRSVTPRWIRARIERMEGLGYIERRSVWEDPDDPAWTKREQKIRNRGRQTANEYIVRARPVDTSAHPPELSTAPPEASVEAIIPAQLPGSGGELSGESVPPLNTEGTVLTGFEVVTGSIQQPAAADAVQPLAVLPPEVATAPRARPDAGEYVAARWWDEQQAASRQGEELGREDEERIKREQAARLLLMDSRAPPRPVGTGNGRPGSKEVRVIEELFEELNLDIAAPIPPGPWEDEPVTRVLEVGFDAVLIDLAQERAAA